MTEENQQSMTAAIARANDDAPTGSMGTETLARTLALMQLAADLGFTITDVVEGMHSNIGRRPLPLSKLKTAKTTGITGLVYGAVGGSFNAIANGLGSASRAIAGDALANTAGNNEPGWVKFRSALNGVCGDALEERQNPLALPMSLQQEVGDSDSLLLFVHGLCMSELGWRGEAYEQFIAKWQSNGGSTAALRYNSGRHISENGADFDKLLEQLVVDRKLKRIVVIGHSMGGLLTRSALNFAEDNGHRWPDKLSHMVLLGSPHNGAPMERAGNMANSLLTMSPYSAALAGLGNIRSAGIRDLRHGSIRPEDWQNMADPDSHDDSRAPSPLSQKPNILMLVGTRSTALPEKVTTAKHDLLVPVSSGLGLHSKPEFRLASPKLTRKLLAATDHIELLWNGNVYQTIERWLNGDDIEPLTEAQMAR